jgi:hypothetical protein
MSRAREVSKIVETVENFDAVEYSSTPPANPQEGALWVDTSTVNPLIKAYNGNDWDTLGSAPVPIITGIAPSNISGSASTAIIVNGTNFESGSIVKLVDNEDNELHVLSTTFNNSQSLQFLTPALTASAGPYDIKVTNTDNQFSVLENSLSVGSTPIWSTPSGSLGIIYDSGRSSTTFSLLATDPDNHSITYSLVSGSLPTGMSLTSGGSISGTSQAVSSDTTYTFTIRVTDSSGSFSNREFSITSKAPVIQSFTNVGSTSWTSPVSGNIKILIVGGGGGAGSFYQAGGGGAGGVVYRDDFSVTKDSSYPIVIGAGGNGSTGTAQSQTNGNNSSFSTLIGLGGGRGGSESLARNSGGSAGGAAHATNYTQASATQPGSASGGFGNAGGYITNSTCCGGAGGGGAGGIGGNILGGGDPGNAGSGGIGIQIDITGTNIYYGGGGAGGGRSRGLDYATGGLGGGGNSGRSGIANTGGGGGGGSHSASVPGGNGGSGVVILRY